MITVADLKDQTGTPEPHPVLHCPTCGETFSANKGDYFNRPETYPFFCCEQPMELAVKKTVYEPSLVYRVMSALHIKDIIKRTQR